MTAGPLLSPRVQFVDALERFGAAPAVRTQDRVVSYAELGHLVAEAGTALGRGRRLVLIAADNTLESLVTYLGALHAGHVPLMAPGDRLQHLDGLVDRYDPDVVVGSGPDGWHTVARRPEAALDLQPEIGALMHMSFF